MFNDAHCIAPWIGIFGDALTFTGAAILAFDAVLQEERFKTIRNKIKAYTSPEFRVFHIKVEEEGQILVRGEKDVEWSHIKHSVKWAKWGTFALTLGFGLLILTRYVEIAYCSK